MAYGMYSWRNFRAWLLILWCCSAIYPGSLLAAEADTRIYTFSSCPATGPLGEVKAGAFAPVLVPIISALIAPLVEAVVDKGVEAIKNAAQDHDFLLDRPTPVYQQFYEIGAAGETRLNRRILCVVVVRSVFEKGDSREGAVTLSSTMTERLMARFRVPDPGSNPLIPGAAKATRLAQLPQFYFEASLVMSDDRQTFAFRPQALYVDDFVSSDGFFGPSQRQYAVTLTFTDAFANQPFASTEFKFEGVKRQHSVAECMNVTSTEYCAATQLGGLHGWYATKSASDDIQSVVKQRQEKAVMISTAVNPWHPPAYAPIPEDQEMTANAQVRLCTELHKVRQSDPACPRALAKAKRDYVYAQTVDRSRLDKQAADEFWDKKCSKFSRNNDGAAECLMDLFGKSPLPAGKFLIGATITETRPGNEVAKFLAPAAQSVAPKVKEALIKQLDPAERQKAKEQQQASVKATRDVRLKATEAELDARLAQIEYDQAMAKLNENPGDGPAQIAVVTKQMVLLQKQADANEAARTANVPIPFANVD